MPITAAGKVAVVMVNAGGGFTVKFIAWVAVAPAASVTVKV